METKTDGRAAVVLNFLARVAANNNRPWFAAHRADYDAARSAFESMATDVLAALGRIDPSVAHLEVKDCMYRFYRDTRFSPDKSPYKRHMGLYVAARGKKSLHGGYYLHLEPGHCFVAGGAYCLPAPVLRAVRSDIVAGIDEFRAIVEAPAFRRLYSTIGMERVKTVPHGVPRDFAYMQYLQPKDYSVWHPVSDDFFAHPRWPSRAASMFAVMKPFLDFVNFSIDQMLDSGLA